MKFDQLILFKNLKILHFPVTKVIVNAFEILENLEKQHLDQYGLPVNTFTSSDTSKLISELTNKSANLDIVGSSCLKNELSSILT